MESMKSRRRKVLIFFTGYGIMNPERHSRKELKTLDNEKKIDPALTEEETEIAEEEFPQDEVVIENFDEDKDEDDELYERYKELMEQEEDEEDDIAAVAERITGERHSRVTTAAPLRIRDPKAQETPAVPVVPEPENTQEFSAPAGGPVSQKPVVKKPQQKKILPAAIAAALVLLIVLTVTVIVQNREEPVQPEETQENLPVVPDEPDVPEEVLPEEADPADTEPEEEEIVLPDPVPEEEPAEDVLPEEPETPAVPEPEVIPEPEPEPVPQYNVTLDFYDRDDITVTVTQMTLAEVYAAAGYTPRESDRPAVGMDYVITSDDWITIAAAEYKNVSVKESIPYGTEEIKVDTIPRGEKRVISSGENGEVTRTYTVEYINGQETNRTFAYEETTKWAVNEKYEIGVGGSFTNANGITYTYNYRRVVPATYYNLEGLTYLGQMADESVIAVDPNNIPLGTKVYVKNDTYDFGVRVAADTGPKVDEWQIDIWLSPYNPQYASFAQVGYHNDMEIYYLD